jgi:hypothetical protein
VATQLAGWRQGRHGRWVNIAAPAEPDPAGGLALWRMLDPLLTTHLRPLMGRRSPVSFEISADGVGLRIGLWVSRTLPVAAVTRAVEAAWPGSAATVTKLPASPARHRVTTGRARLGNPDWLPLNTDTLSASTRADPIAALLSATATDGAGTVLYQVLARPARPGQISRARHAARSLRKTSRRGQALGVGADPFAQADVRDITAKTMAGPHFETAIRYTITTPAGVSRRAARRSRRATSRQIAAALGLYAGRNHLITRRHHLARRRANRRLRRGFLVSAAELAALAHLPTEPARYGLPTPPARTVAPPPEVAHA